MNKMFDISYADIEVIKNLWEKNRQYHEKTSEHFKESYRLINFDDRIKAYLEVFVRLNVATVLKPREEE